MISALQQVPHQVKSTELNPDTIMKREALCGASARGPTAVTVLWPLTFANGQHFSMPLCAQTLEILTRIHPNLQTAFHIQGSQVKWFKLDPVHVPITVYEEEGGPNDWRGLVKSELRKPFDDPRLPAWRAAVALKKGVATDKQNTVTMLFTALHGLCDGVCLAQLAVTFNETMAKLQLGRPVILKVPEASPALELLYKKFPGDVPEEASRLPSQTFHPCDTGFAIHVFDKSPGLVEALKRLCHQHSIKVHSTLVAALVLAVKKVKNPPDETFQSLSIVSFRDLLGVSKQLFRPLFSWLKVEEVNPARSFLEIAARVHKELHDQLDRGKHVENLKISEAQLQKGPTPEELLSQVRFPRNLVNLTNRQEIGSTGKYPECDSDPIITMESIYGFGGNSPYFGLQGPGGFGLTVGVTTFNNVFFCSASCIEDTTIGLGEEMSEQVLRTMEDILIEHAFKFIKT